MTTHQQGSPFAPHTEAETAAMLDAIGVADTDALFDIPESVQFSGTLEIEGASERETRREVRRTLDRDADLVSFLGRGHYDHYVPAVVEDLSGRSEFLSSYTQYQPEVAQGFLQALFEYQSMLVELTGLPVANCSMHDAATALGEAARLASRVREADGHRVLVPETMHEGRRRVLENYTVGSELTVETYPTTGGTVDVAALRDRADESAVLVHAESPTVRGAIEESLSAVGDVAAAHDALFCLGTDPVAMALLESPASVGADVVVGDAGTLGLGAANGMGHGIFATREAFRRQVPGRLVGAGEDASGRRAYTLTLQTREQHIRRERATSNICTNQAWLALRSAIHVAVLGPEGLLDIARTSVKRARSLAKRIDGIDGVRAPIHDRHYFREFPVRTDQPAPAIREDLLERGFAVHALDEHTLQVCVTDTTEAETGRFVTALREVA